MASIVKRKSKYSVVYGKYSTYYTSVGYTNQDGTMKGTNYQRTSADEMMVREPPFSMLRAAPKNFFGG